MSALVRTSSHYDFMRAYNNQVYAWSPDGTVEFEFRTGGDRGDTFKFVMDARNAESLAKDVIEKLAKLRQCEES